MNGLAAKSATVSKDAESNDVTANPVMMGWEYPSCRLSSFRNLDDVNAQREGCVPVNKAYQEGEMVHHNYLFILPSGGFVVCSKKRATDEIHLVFPVHGMYVSLENVRYSLYICT